jgi:DNA-binding LacI/PurR family transcriptional regulator
MSTPPPMLDAHIIVANKLRAMIGSNQYQSLKLPTERELSRQFGEGVRTIRKALELLAREGLLSRRQGSGTYINRHKPIPLIADVRRTHMLCYVSGTGSEWSIGNFFNQLMIATQAEANRLGYVTVMASIQDGKVPMPVKLQKVDGVVFAGTYYQRRDRPQFTLEDIASNNTFITRVVEAGLPVVAVSNPTDCQTVHRVMPDYDFAIREALIHLRSLGHRRVSVFGGPRHWPAFSHRIDSFLRQAHLLGMAAGEEVVAAYPTWTYLDKTATIDCVKQHLLKPGPRPTAGIVISGAPGIALAGINAAGLSCPHQFSLMAFADTRRDEQLRPINFGSDEEVPPGMSTLDMPVAELAHAAVTRLTDVISGKIIPHEMRDILVPLNLTLGTSIAPVNASP